MLTSYSVNNKPKQYVRKADSETYTLTVVTRLDADNVRQMVYQVRNAAHYYECSTKEQFEKEFESL